VVLTAVEVEGFHSQLQQEVDYYVAAKSKVKKKKRNQIFSIFKRR
jgi:hypothetical protein